MSFAQRDRCSTAPNLRRERDGDRVRRVVVDHPVIESTHDHQLRPPPAVEMRCHNRSELQSKYAECLPQLIGSVLLLHKCVSLHVTVKGSHTHTPAAAAAPVVRPEPEHHRPAGRERVATAEHVGLVAVRLHHLVARRVAERRALVARRAAVRVRREQHGLDLRRGRDDVVHNDLGVLPTARNCHLP